ncbi:MAG: PadR family transcriptional regulator [Thermoplasmata archaeon]
MPAELYCYCGPFRISLVPRGLLKPVILRLLRGRPMHGFEIMEEITARTGGMWRPGPGAVYPALLALEEEGYVTVGEKGERAKKPYTITDKGREAVADLGDVMEDWETSMDTLESLLTVRVPR